MPRPARQDAENSRGLPKRVCHIRDSHSGLPGQKGRRWSSIL